MSEPKPPMLIPKHRKGRFSNNTISKWQMATSWKSYLKYHPKWEVNCGQHMEVKYLLNQEGGRGRRGVWGEKTNHADLQESKEGNKARISTVVHNDFALFMWMEIFTLELRLIKISIFISVTSFNPHNSLKNEAKNRLPFPPSHRHVDLCSRLLNDLPKFYVVDQCSMTTGFWMSRVLLLFKLTDRKLFIV